MIRRWVVEPDELGVVTQERLAQELSICAVIIDKIGGHLRVTTHRQRSDRLDGEAFTIGTVIEWVDRTDDVKAAPEQELRPPVAVPEPPAEPATVAEGLRDTLTREPVAEEDGVIYDGDGEPEEDLTSIPAAAR